MAKRDAAALTSTSLFPDLKRKHPHLILPRLLTERATENPFDPARLQVGQDALRRWAELATGAALTAKETALDAEFLKVIFGEALGYRGRTDTPDAFQIERQFPVPEAGYADAALGTFVAGQPLGQPAVVVECKGIKTDLDHDKSNGKTAVEQLWGYLDQLPDTPFGILTNYLVIRLYHHGSPKRVYQEFVVTDFFEPDKAAEFIFLFEPVGLLGRGRVERPRTLDLLTRSRDRRIEVGDDLYNYYSDQRHLLIAALIDKHGYATDDAIHAAQLLLDRVIFVAFCEDRGLLPPKLLENTWKNVPPLARAGSRWRNFLDMFNAIDRGHAELDLPTGYNGGLFKEDPLVDRLDLDGDPWTDVFNRIGNYDFRDEGEISVDVLGHLFERSVTELEKFRAVGLFGRQKGTDADNPAMPKSAARKRFGIYYTPPAFTRFIVERTVGHLVAERVEPLPDLDAQAMAMRAVRVVDPACGSGAFLIAAYDALEDAYESILIRLRRDGRTADAAALAVAYPDRILADNLFGVDLSRESVEITKLALWIRSARKGTPLSNLSSNILCGNSLVSDPAVSDRPLDWSVAFPEIMAAGGFDAVVGNPPWERVKVQEREFFSLSSPAIASAVNAADRRRLIAAVEAADPDLWTRYQAARDAAERTSTYVRKAGRFPLTGRGDVNTYMLFAELARTLVAPAGLVGLLVPSGIATDDTTKHFFGDLMDTKSIAALYDFENRDGIFPDVDGRFKFCVLLMNGGNRKPAEADFVFFARNFADLKPRDRHIKLSARDLKLLNPNTRTCPIFRTRRDAELTRRVYENVPVLIDRNRKAGGNPWGVRFVTMFHQTNDANLFRTAAQLAADGFTLAGNHWVRGDQTYLPLYEAKMVQAYDHRAAGVVVRDANWMRQGQTEETPPVFHQNPEFVVMPRYWVDQAEVASVVGGDAVAFVGFKDITSPTNQRTMIASVIPRSAVANHFVLMLIAARWRRQLCLLANLNSLAFDYITRQKIGGITLNFFIVEQLPTLPPERYQQHCPWAPAVSLEAWVSERVLKLTCTADDMRPLAAAAGFAEGVHRWDEAERAVLRAELDAAYFHLYGLSRDEVDYVLNSFQGVTREDRPGQPGPTRRAVLEAYDAIKPA